MALRAVSRAETFAGAPFLAPGFFGRTALARQSRAAAR
jgi:hypothetical protein